MITSGLLVKVEPINPRVNVCVFVPFLFSTVHVSSGWLDCCLWKIGVAATVSDSQDKMDKKKEQVDNRIMYIQLRGGGQSRVKLNFG